MAKINIADIVVPMADDSKKLSGLDSDQWMRVIWVSTLNAARNFNYAGTVTTAIYLIVSDAVAAACEGLPVKTAGILICGFSAYGYYQQLYLTYSKNQMFVRSPVSGGYSAWERVTTTPV